MGKLIVTARDLYREGSLKNALREIGLEPKSTGFRSVVEVESDRDIFEVAHEVARKYPYDIGRVVAVFEEVESEEGIIKERAVFHALEQIKENESFCFRVHKRGKHKIEKPTPEFEYDVGGTIYEELEKKYNKKPAVNLKNPDIAIVAEVLGPKTLLGIYRKSWSAE
ncbi:MAG: THUMP domain-containing protein [Candidatus Thermoplasmatota archaeon]|nr:THUMP domain-containing protein [Candidatus Thermoplasmatota archaeon]